MRLLIHNLVVSASAVISLLHITVLVRLLSRITPAGHATGVGALYAYVLGTLLSPFFWIGAVLLILLSMLLTGGLLPLLPVG
jgi:hypothetical protein